MALASTLQSRIQEMEEHRRLLLQRLQAETDLHCIKRAQLSEKNTMLAGIRRRCLVLQQMEAELALKVLEKEEELKDVNESLVEVIMKQRTLTSELEALHSRRRERMTFYDEKRNMMDAHKIRLQGYMLNLENEVDGLKKTLFQLETRGKETREKGSVSANDINKEIGNEEKIKLELSAQLDAQESQMPGCNVKFDLENKMNQAQMEIEQKKQILEKQKMEILKLQIHNQSLENRVFECIENRGQKKGLSGAQYMQQEAIRRKKLTIAMEREKSATHS